MRYVIEDLRIKASKILLPPAFLEEEMPVTENASRTVHQARTEICEILRSDHRRLLVVVGPCSIHDPDAAREYAARLAIAKREFAADLCIVMRVYFEKPRTTVGWKGLINDPYLDGSFTKSMMACAWLGDSCLTSAKWEYRLELNSST